MESKEKTIPRSVSMPTKPKYIEMDNLHRSDEKENLFPVVNAPEDDEEDDDDEIRILHKDLKINIQIPDENLDNVSSDDIVPELATVTHYVSRRRQSENFFGSTIEINDELSKSDEFGKKKIAASSSAEKLIIKSKLKRLISKNGHQNVSFKNIPKKSIRFLKDLVTTLIEESWTYTISLFLFLFIGSWFGFALLWYIISNSHGDFDIDPTSGNRLNEDRPPCVKGAYDMTSMFIYSIETQSTIGFGDKYPTEECPEGVILFLIQIVISIGFEGAMVAVVYAKMSRPVKKIYSKLTFSKTACICLRDENLCFVFRVCDEFEQRSIGTKIRAYLILDLKTPEGESMKVHTELKLEGNGIPMVMWPETICHIIDKDSPFYEFKSIDFKIKQYEILVSLVGHSQSTGQITEAMTSYLPNEVLWGHRFVNVISYNDSHESYAIDYGNFHTTESHIIANKSASQMERKISTTSKAF